MKVLLFNGSPHAKGCTFTALSEVQRAIEDEGVETSIFQLGIKPVRGCLGCHACSNHRCVFDDDVANRLIEAFDGCDAFVVGSPVYYASPNGALLAVLDRVFFAASPLFAFKPAAAIVSARRAGTTAALDVLYKYFTISNMPIAGSQYWPMVHGHTPDDVRQDLEGMQTMRLLGKNLVWLMRGAQAQRTPTSDHPTLNEDRIHTNFIR